MISLPVPKLDLDFLNSGELEKMKIEAYPDAAMQGNLIGEMNVFINPETYSVDYKIKVSSDQPLGASGAHLKYEQTEPSEISFEFLFDSTGIITNTPKDDVSSSISKFKNLVYNYHGEHHEVPYVKLAWGDTIFAGRLTNLSIQYKLFSPNGKPIRALAKATFKASISEEKRVAEEKKSSPDLTHIRIVKAGDTLPLMCQRIYEDPKYYLQVAKINRLGNFRQLTPGMELVFPPIEKTNTGTA